MANHSFSDVLTDQQISLFSMKIPANSLYSFAFSYLNLTNLQIINASGQLITPLSETILRALSKWRNCRKPPYTAVEFREKLRQAQLAGLKIHQSCLNYFKNSKEGEDLTNRQLSLVSRLLSETVWEVFATVHLGIDLAVVSAFMPARGEPLSRNAVGIMQTWRNINGYDATWSRLKQAVTEAVEDGVMPKEALEELENITLEKLQQDDRKKICEPFIRKHYTQFIADLEADIADYLFEQRKMTKADHERVGELRHRSEKAKLILDCVMRHDSQETLDLFKSYLQRTQPHLAALINA